MMKLLRLLVSLSIMVGTLSASVPENYELVFADDFDRNGAPDPAKWGYENGFERNRELQWYQPDNAIIENGHLVIEGRREKKRNPNYDPSSSDWRKTRSFADYTSSSLTTRGKFSWQYGILEVRGKISAEQGVWPAIWTLGVDGEWPSNGEVDLMEYYGDNILANACWGSSMRWQPVWDSAKVPVASLGGINWDKEFHTWRMYWDENKIELSLDGRVLNTIDLSKTFNQNNRGPPNPFRQPHYLILNLAIGGDAGGDPSSTKFPSRYEIDYVRIYKKKPESIYGVPKDYRLVFGDEFNKAGRPDPVKWGYEHGFKRNHELQWYQTNNAVVENGRLVIEGRRENRWNPNYDPTSSDWRENRQNADYTSASLTTKGTFSWQYGILEVRAKIDAEPGVWPAIWTLGVEGEWPSNGEVDLMQFFGGVIRANAGWGTTKRWHAQWKIAEFPVASLGGTDWDEDFHTWRMYWDDNKIELTLDGKVLNSINLNKTVNKSNRGPTNPFRQPHYLMLNLAIGGSGGDPSWTKFPSRYEIDYVRVFQKRPASGSLADLPDGFTIGADGGNQIDNNGNPHHVDWELQPKTP